MSESGHESDAEYMYESSSDLGNEEDAMYEYEDESYPETNDLGSNLMNENLVSTGKSVGYQILNYESVEKIMKSVVDNVGSVLDVDYQQAQLLLTSQRWDEEKLIESYFANPEELCKESGIDLYEIDVIQRRLDSRMNVSPFLCKICYDDASTEGFCLGCNHQFCISCYEGYLHNQVSEGPLCVMARCPEFKCTQAIPPIVYHTLLNSTEDKITYQRYALRQFIEANKSYRYCPAPNCECISVGSGETHVICTCGYQYCFHCTAEDHRPCSCITLSKWVDKCNNDSETANWMAVNTKPCPKCISRIEKNQGCNHMTCRQCKHEFCWLCFGDWKGHTACNRYNSDGKEVGEEENSIQKKKRDLERYMHYYKRYQNHEIAEKFAVKQRMKTELLLTTLQEQDCLVLQDAQCVREATEQVISCRRVLKYTYVIGYYMEDTAVNKQLFERHQEMLEENTERLQEFIETKNLKSLDRTELINYTRITERFRNSLLDDIHDEAALPPPPPLKRQTSSKSSTGGNKGKKNSSSGGGLVATAAAALNSFISSSGSASGTTTGPVTRSRAEMNA